MLFQLKINSSAIKSNGSAYSFLLVGEQAAMLLRSELYRTKDSALKGIRAIKKNASLDRRYLLKESTNGMYFFNLKSANGLTVATSALFSTENDRAQAINTVKTGSATAEVVEVVVEV